MHARTLTRRQAIQSGLRAGLYVGMSAGTLLTARPALALSPGRPVNWKPILARWADLEKESGGRLGCALLDTATGERFAHRGTERFPMCSTFKLLAAGLVLKRVDQGAEQLDRRIAIAQEDLLPYAPVTKEHVVGGGMTVEELCVAAITMSDNTAANLLLKSFGGPQAVTRFAASLGDSMTRLDRTEPTLNDAVPGDDRDTTAPSRMLEDLRQLVLGDALSAASRGLLTDWLVGCETGDARLRGGVPAEWKAGDKTGSGEHNTTNDVAIFWPPRRAPILVSAYLTESTLDSDARSGILARIGRAVADRVAGV